MRSASPRSLLVSLLGGVVGGLIGAAVMSAGHAALTAIGDDGAAPRADQQEEDATVTVAEAVSRTVRGRSLSESEKPVAGHLVHYSFGAAMGAVYGAAATAMPVVTVGRGAAFGAAVWLGAHMIVVPALGLSPLPLRQPLAREARELLLHLAYGVALGTVWKVAIRISR